MRDIGLQYVEVVLLCESPPTFAALSAHPTRFSFSPIIVQVPLCRLNSRQ